LTYHEYLYAVFYSVDATAEPSGDGTPHLCMFSLRCIGVGEEIVYNYGVKKLPFDVVEVSVPFNCFLAILR
jgi:hypothetical protein